MKLKKVIIFSRHGQRYPLFKKEEMSEILDYEKLNWNFEDSILTDKGEILEYEFGKYLKNYLRNLDINIETKEFYANSLKRTVLTSKLLALAMFPFEDIKVDYKYKDLESMDANFNIYLKGYEIDNSKFVKQDLELKRIYNKLEKILKLDENKIYSVGTSVSMNKDGYIHSDGALNLATNVIDMYILKYYEGFPLNDIFESNNFREDLKELSIIRDALLDSIFADKDYIKYSKYNAYNLIRDLSKSSKDLSVVVGHDSNIATILSALDIETKGIGNEFEKYPIGSKLVFKVYENNKFDLDLLYFDVDKIRYMEKREPITINLGRNLEFREIN